MLAKLDNFRIYSSIRKQNSHWGCSPECSYPGKQLKDSGNILSMRSQRGPRIKKNSWLMCLLFDARKLCAVFLEVFSSISPTWDWAANCDFVNLFLVPIGASLWIVVASYPHHGEMCTDQKRLDNFSSQNIPTHPFPFGI